MFDRVLILSASAGAGHLRAAEAVEKAMVQLGAAREIRNLDTLQYTSKLFHNLYSKAYLEVVDRAPDVYGWLYDHFDRPWKNQRRRLALEKFNARSFVKMIQEYDPEMTICTYYLPAEIISWLREKRRLRTRQAIVITDFDVHAMWLCRHYEHYFVALEETRAHLMELGVPADKVTVSGIPIDPVFAEPKDKDQMRRKFGLAPDLLTLLVSAGGFGVGPVEKLIQALAKMRHNVQAVIVCGRNEELKKRVERQIADLASDCRVRLVPIGFTTEMDSYMSASDMVLGKPGGLTTSEALAKGLAMVIVNPIRGQEERNADHLLEEGVAIRCNNLPVLAYKIDKLLDDPGKLDAMQAHAGRLARPRAALELVQKLCRL